MYDNHKIGDHTFGVNEQALAILALLEQTTPNFAEYIDKEYQISFNTYPWYNGRERGIVISMQPDQIGEVNKTLHIAFFECRNSDSIHCLRWETSYFYLNSPTFENARDKAFPDKSSSPYKSFPHEAIGECKDWIINEFTEFYEAHHKYPKSKEN